jgi:hypothetical protein
LSLSVADDAKSDDEREGEAGDRGNAADGDAHAQPQQQQLDADGNALPKPIAIRKRRGDGHVAGAATLESNADNLNQKKCDEQFDTDPLNRATAKQFDQGGCRGLVRVRA